MYAFGVEFLGCRNLRHDDALGVAGTASVNALGRLRRRNERRHRVHVSREHQFWTRMAGVCGPYVKALALHRHALDGVAEGGEFVREDGADRGFIAGDRLDVDKFAGEGEEVHVCLLYTSYAADEEDSVDL